MANQKEINTNPYLSAQNTWKDYVGSIVGARNILIATTFLSLSIALVSVVGVVHIGSQSKLTPYVIEVDKLGQSQFAGTIPNYDFRDPKIINVMLTDFVSDFRTVSIDKELSVKLLQRLYAKLDSGSTANAKISNYFTANDEKNNPFIRSEKEVVTVEVKSILQVTGTTYAIEWSEYIRGAKSGKLESTNFFKANVTIEYKDTSNFSFDSLIANPLGMYIVDFDLQKL